MESEKLPGWLVDGEILIAISLTQYTLRPSILRLSSPYILHSIAKFGFLTSFLDVPHRNYAYIMHISTDESQVLLDQSINGKI